MGDDEVASDPIEKALKIPDHVDREWLRGWHSSSSICKKLFARSGKKQTASLVTEFTSRNGGPMKCMSIPTSEGQHPFKYLYQPLQMIKVFHVKKIAFDFGEGKKLSILDEIKLLEQKRDDLEKYRNSKSYNELIRVQALRSRPSANCSHLYPYGKPLDHDQVMNLSGAVPESLSGVYFLIRNDEVVYVGKSKNMLNRIQDHIANPEKVFNRFTFFPTHPSSAMAVESYYISLFRPRLNAVAGMSLSRVLDEVSEQ